jgi:uncharacterized repeat protein (TIGR01451 family)
VTNTGNVPLSNVSVTDDQGVVPVYQSGDTNNNSQLDLGETWVYTATGTAIAGQYNNTGTASGQDSLGTSVNDNDASSYFGNQPGIHIVKLTNGVDTDTSSQPVVAAGSTVTWTYDVTNTGNVPLSNVSVSDNQAGVTPVYQSGDTNNNGQLDLGETWVYTATGIAIAGQYNNTGTASGKDSLNKSVSDNDASSYFGNQPGIHIVKLTNGVDTDTSSQPVVAVGSTVTWTYDVTNTGNVPLSNVSVSDNQAGVTPVYQSGDTNHNGQLDTGETWVYSETGTAILGQYNNTGTASGKDSLSKSVTDSDTSSYLGVQYGSISGKKFLDLTGDGFSTDDTPLQGVTIQLYKDTQGTGVLDTTKDPVVATATTGTDGSYSFGTLSSGTYFVKELVPTGYIATEPTSGYYTAKVSSGSNITNDNFDDFALDCDLSKFVCVTYKVTDNGCTKIVTNLRDNTHEGDTVSVTFTYTGTAPDEVALVSYTAPGSSFNANTASQQEIFQEAVQQLNGPGTFTLTVTIPNCYYQIDFVCGPVIDQFGPAGSNIFYTPQGRLISADNGGIQVCGVSSLSGYEYVDANANGSKDSGESGIAGVTMTLTGIDYDGNAVSKTATTGANGYYQFTNLQGSNAAGYTITETPPAGYLDGKDSVGSVGGVLGSSQISKIFLNTNTAGVNYNFASVQTSSLSGYVYNDINDNFQKDSGEAGIGSVKVTLTGKDDLGNAVNTSTTTSASGAFSFTNLRPGTYTLTETEPSGYSHTGNAIGTVNGAADGALDAALAEVIKSIVLPSGSSGVNYDFGEILAGSCVVKGQTATIGFWNSCNGQSLINSFNGCSTSKTLATWLATSFPNLYGPGSPGHTNPYNLTGKTNADVAALFQTFFGMSGLSKTNAQVLAVALDVYATTTSLGGAQGGTAGFKVTAGGVGSATDNIGSNGAAFGVSNNTTLPVSQILQYANSQSANGVLYALAPSEMSMVNSVFAGINQAGDKG